MARKLGKRPEIVFAYAHRSALEHLAYNSPDVTVYVNPAAVVKDKALDYEMVVGVELKIALRFSRSTFACRTMSRRILLTMPPPCAGISEGCSGAGTAEMN
ncbi:hypothetical protein ACP3TJ_09255 [Desulforudis sp. 1088]|uniref:hypothetical protein n=1 Tax=unclassified Candidatus Desulforudis TaxID=2635950 RepID=UPI003CE576C6